MTMAYEDYRDTNSQWVDRIPAHWRIERLKFVARPQASNVDKHSKDDEIPVRLCNYTDVYNNAQITADMDFMEATATQAEIDKFALTDDEVIITKDSESWQDIAVPAHVPKAIEGVLCGYHLTQIRPDQEQLDGRYLYYQLCSAALNRQFQVKANGVTRFGLPAYHIHNAETIVPPLDEQRAIARFLDERTKRIRDIIDRKVNLRRHLVEKREAFISRAVTYGISPEAQTVQTGISFLPEVPSHWETKRLKFLAEIRYGLGEPPERDIDGIPFVRATDIYRGKIDLTRVTRVNPDSVPWDRRPALQENELLVVRSGAYTGDSALVTGDAVGCIAGYDMVVTPKNIRPRFLAWAMLSKYLLHGQIYLARQRAAQPHLNAEELGDLIIAVPRGDEQDEIAQAVEIYSEKIEGNIREIDKAIHRLTEYSDAIITAAITGQIKVV